MRNRSFLIIFTLWVFWEKFITFRSRKFQIHISWSLTLRTFCSFYKIVYSAHHLRLSQRQYICQLCNVWFVGKCQQDATRGYARISASTLIRYTFGSSPPSDCGTRLFHTAWIHLQELCLLKLTSNKWAHFYHARFPEIPNLLIEPPTESSSGHSACELRQDTPLMTEREKKMSSFKWQKQVVKLPVT